MGLSVIVGDLLLLEGGANISGPNLRLSKKPRPNCETLPEEVKLLRYRPDPCASGAVAGVRRALTRLKESSIVPSGGNSAPAGAFPSDE